MWPLAPQGSAACLGRSVKWLQAFPSLASSFPLRLIFRIPSQFCFLRVSFFSHSLPVSIPSRKVLESRLLFERLHLRSGVLLSRKFFEWLSRDVTTVKISLIIIFSYSNIFCCLGEPILRKFSKHHRTKQTFFVVVVSCLIFTVIYNYQHIPPFADI